MKYLASSSQTKKNEKLSLVLDVGTTGVHGCVFDDRLELRAKAYQLLSKNVHGLCVEQDPREILNTSISVLKKCIREVGVSVSSIATFGMTNQRETVIAWDRVSGKPLCPAIVWEDRRTAKECQLLRRKHETVVREKTGLPILPYFSASKMAWILKQVPLASNALSKGRLAIGTVDSWILWNFLEGHPLVTDYTNASRTLLFNIRTLAWDNELLNLFNIPRSILPDVFPSQHVFGVLKKSLFGSAIPVNAVCGDQQASMAAAGVKKGTTKITYGTGTFIMQSIGSRFSVQPHFFTTLLPSSGKAIYALEQKVEGSGEKTQGLLNHPVKLRAYLQKLAEQVQRHVAELPQKPQRLIVDGGVSRDGIVAECQEKVSRIPVRRQKIIDGTSLGVAMLLQQYIKMKGE